MSIPLTDFCRLAISTTDDGYAVRLAPVCQAQARLIEEFHRAVDLYNPEQVKAHMAAIQVAEAALAEAKERAGLG